MSPRPSRNSVRSDVVRPLGLMSALVFCTLLVWLPAPAHAAPTWDQEIIARGLATAAPPLADMVANSDVELIGLETPFVEHALVAVNIYGESHAVSFVVAVDSNGVVTMLSGEPAAFNTVLAGETLALDAAVARNMADLFLQATQPADDPITWVEAAEALPFRKASTPEDEAAHAALVAELGKDIAPVTSRHVPERDLWCVVGHATRAMTLVRLEVIVYTDRIEANQTVVKEELPFVWVH